LSAPKKGKDLSALKARLAKKAAAAAPPGGDIPPPGASLPAPGEYTPPPEPDVPPPGEVAAAPAADIPAPGEQIPAPGEQIPAPGEQVPPPGEVVTEVATAVAEAPAGGGSLNAEGDVFSGGSTFDPNDGLIGGADIDITPRKNTGLALAALAGGIVIGGMLGWVGHDVSNKRAMAGQAKDKAGKMIDEVARVAETRKTIALQFEDVVKKIKEKPDEGMTELTTLYTNSFGKDANFPQVEDLFGWQLASLHPNSVRRIFGLYKNANDLVMDMGFLAQYVAANSKAMAGGPKAFAVSNGTLVEFVGLVCGMEGEGEAAKPVDCTAETAAQATHMKVRDTPGGGVKMVEVATTQAIKPAGAMYLYAIGANPERNPAQMVDMLSANVEARLAEMGKLEEKAKKALAAYSDDPTLDDESEQSDPG
jgi:hypothetical protein